MHRLCVNSYGLDGLDDMSVIWRGRRDEVGKRGRAQGGTRHKGRAPEKILGTGDHEVEMQL